MAPPDAGRGKWSLPTRMITGLITSVLLISILLNIYLGAFVAASMSGPRESVYQKGNTAHRIVILPIDGMIGDEMAEHVRRACVALRDKKPQAIVLRVESGGGTVGASDRIWHELTRFKQETQIPVIASFGAIAASGGYYVAMPADQILVEPTSITGSIGVMAQAFTVDRLLEKIGVSPEVMVATESPQKDTANNIMRPWTPEDRQVITRLLDTSHLRFVEVVRQGRAAKLTAEQVTDLATGRIFTAQEAVDSKLVDSIGYLDEAIALAARQAGIDEAIEPHVTILRPARSMGLLGLLGSHRGVGSASAGISSQQVRQWAAELAVPSLEYRMALPLGPP